MKPNLFTEITDTIFYIVKIVVGTVFLTFFVGALFAPCFEALVVGELPMKAAGMGASTVADLESANRKLLLARIGLWITAIAAWGLLIVSNVIYWGIR